MKVISSHIGASIGGKKKKIGSAVGAVSMMNRIIGV